MDEFRLEHNIYRMAVQKGLHQCRVFEMGGHTYRKREVQIGQIGVH